MRGLNYQAKETLALAGIPQATFGRENFRDAEVWHGDACGCTDDRCIGFHHDADEDCLCLPAQIENRERDAIIARLARLAGIPDADAADLVWAAIRDGNTRQAAAWERRDAARRAAAAAAIAAQTEAEAGQ